MSKELTIRDSVAKMGGQFDAVLPPQLSRDRFMRIIFTALQTNPKLEECTQASVLSACMKAAEQGLAPDGQQGALVPYWDKNKRCYLAQWLPMYQGLLEVTRRSGQTEDIYAYPIYQEDEWDLTLGTNRGLTHKPAKRPQRGPVIAFYAIAFIKGAGTPHVEFMWKDEVDDIKARAKSTSGPWLTDYNEMGRKTALRRVLKYCPKTPELSSVLESDQDIPSTIPVDIQVSDTPAGPPEDRQKKALDGVGKKETEEVPPPPPAGDQQSSNTTPTPPIGESNGPGAPESGMAPAPTEEEPELEVRRRRRTHQRVFREKEILTCGITEGQLTEVASLTDGDDEEVMLACQDYVVGVYPLCENAKGAKITWLTEEEADGLIKMVRNLGKEVVEPPEETDGEPPAGSGTRVKCPIDGYSVDTGYCEAECEDSGTCEALATPGPTD